jgi:cytoskeletal protein CcmA (bactofilin family)
MAINFPNNPTLNQTITSGENSWVWNGSSWEVKPVASPSFTNISVSSINSSDSSEISVNTKTVFQSDVDIKNDVSITGTVIANRFIGSVTGSVTGNASTASTLATARNINGVGFNGGSNITVTADASTLSNTELNNTVVDSNLSTVGVLTELEVAGDITADANIVVATTPTVATHATNKKYVDTRAIAMSIAMS